jgi:ribonuclease-3 family protein
MKPQYMNTTALAFLGDAIYEAYVRADLISVIKGDAGRLHKEAVKFVRADAQARVMKQLLNKLSWEETALVKRARNKKSLSCPRNTDPALYRWATAFEAFIAYLYLSGNKERMEEIIKEAIESVKEDEG